MRSASKHVYGPVPSRRLGRSLGIDLVPYKTCSYDCAYCQLGRTTCRTVTRREWLPLDDVISDLEETLAPADGFDVVTLSGSGEPTLHSRVGELVRWLKRHTELPVAVLTNGSLLWRPDVRDELADADLVIPSLDAADPASFRYANRPHPVISFEALVEGLVTFTRTFRGRVWLEVMLLADVTGIEQEVAAIARLAHRIGPERVHLGTVTRPPAELLAQPVPPNEMERLSRLFEPAAEVVSEPASAADRGARTTTDEAVLALLERRPCTLQDLARGLDSVEPQVIKTVARLLRDGVVRPRHQGDRIYYRVVSQDGVPA